MAKARLDIHQHVTDTIVAQIEAGTPPWRKPWTGDRAGASLPFRHNGEAYRGINVLVLWAVAHARGYSSARWMTFRQALELGGQVRKGAKAARSVFYGSLEREEDAGMSDTDTEGKAAASEHRRIAYAKCNHVFNADEIEGLPESYYHRPDPPRDLGTTPDAALDRFFAATGATLVTSSEPRAYYDLKGDHIHMPPIATFHAAAGYYGTLAHEVTHWSGAESRLDRIGRFADRKAYAFEELVAEIGNCLLSVELGVTPDFGQSAAYVEGWLAALKGDKTLIFKAASEAQKAVDYILAAAEDDEAPRAGIAEVA